MKRLRVEMRGDERKEARAVADYWVKVMDRLHRMQSRKMSRDQRIQKRIKKQRIPF